MKTLTQIWRAARVYVLAFLANLAAQSIFTQAAPAHWTWAAVSSAIVAALEVTYRQFIPAADPVGSLKELSAAIGLLRAAGKVAQNASAPVSVHVEPPAPTQTTNA